VVTPSKRVGDGPDAVVSPAEFRDFRRMNAGLVRRISASHCHGRVVGLRSLLAVSILLALGCREELGPEPMPTARVTGKVHIRATPVGGGWIEFYPTEGTVGKVRSAPLRPDGTFEADRVSVGRNAIQIANPSTPLFDFPRGASPFERVAVIRRDITTAPETTIDIDLQDEFLLLLRDSAARSRPRP
jgi:hypothetical protein